MMLSRKRVVITGMGHLSSIGNNIEEYKQALLNKVCGIKTSEKYIKIFEDANASEITQPVEWPALSREVADNLDKAALWAYKVGHEALTQAAISAEALRAKTGLVVGVSSAGTEAFVPLIEDRFDEFSLTKAALCGSFSSCTAIVSSLLGLKGGFELVATACTASTNAMGIGYDLIQNGKNPTVLIIGTEPLYLPTFAGFYALHAMKRTPSSPFSGAPGMSIGEGAGALLLEDYDHAIARGATILGEMVSYATSCDAYHETAPDPRGEGATQVMRKAMANAAIEPDQIDYINAHGTGTEANDRSETLAMKKIFPNIMSVPVSSTKAYVGHNIGAAGILEITACYLMLAEGKILPTLNFTTPRPNCDLNYVPNEFQYKDVGLFMKNNYAFGGNNCCVIGSVKPGHFPVSQYQPKRVVITGQGAVGSLGHDLKTMLDKIWRQQPPARLRMLTGDMKIQDSFSAIMDTLLNKLSPDKNYLLNHRIGIHEITDLDPRKTLRRYDPRKADAVSTFALVAFTEAMKDAGRKIKRDGHELGMILGMAKGPQSTIFRYLQSLYPDATKVRTSEFPGALMNAVSTFCSISEGVKGYNTSLASGTNAALGAITYGYEIIRQSLQPQMVVGGADENMTTFSLYLQALGNDMLLADKASDYQLYSEKGNGFIPGEGAGMLFIEAMDNALARNAPIHAEIIGYGKASDACYFDKNNLSERSSAMASAIRQALDEAVITVDEIDLICGTSNGTEINNLIETEAIRKSFGSLKQRIPVVNYNGWFGLVESCTAVLNISIVTEIMKKGEIPPIPFTQKFCAEDINFVSNHTLKKKVNTALIIGMTEGGAHYALLLRKAA